VGQSDVQLVIDGVRQELEPKFCGVMHAEIERRKWRLVDAPTHKNRERTGELPEGDIVLCTPKVDAILANVTPTAALVLETRRDVASAPGDPRISGSLVESRLRDRGVQTVHRVAYLTGKERLEDRNTPQDSVVRREVVRRLEDAVCSTIKAANPSRIVVATTGGFPVVSNLVEDIVRLHAPVDVEALEVADGANAVPPTADRAVARTSVPEPLTSFQARRRVLELVDRGNLLGAWAVAEPLHDDPMEHHWTQTVQWLACFASSLPMPDDCDILLLKHPRMAVRAALRVELALRAQDIPRAIHGTVAFFEAALWDGLYERVERSEDPKRRRYFRFKDGEVPVSGKLFRLGDGSSEDRKRPFEKKDTTGGVSWYWIYDSDGGPAGRLAKNFLKRDALVTFNRSLGSEVRAQRNDVAHNENLRTSYLSELDVRDLRNDVAHNEPTPELMADARSLMQSKKLWSDQDTFLSQSLTQKVLRELGVSCPDQLADNLIKEIRERLLHPSK